MPKDGRNATRPYRVRAGGTWYWVDPNVPADTIEPGDTVVLDPVAGDATVAVLERRADAAAPWRFTADGEGFEVAAREIAMLHLAAVDDEQG